MKAVLTADIIDSGSLEQEFRKRIPLAAARVLSTAIANPLKYSFGRGDLIQAEMEAKQGLRVLLNLKTALNGIGNPKRRTGFREFEVDARFSLGLGEVGFEGETADSSDGSAYRLSGRALDQMKKSRHRISMGCIEEDFNEELAVMSAALEFITARWTLGSAELIGLLLEERKETEIAEALGISQSAVNQRKRTAGWEIIQQMLIRYERKCEKLK